MKKTQEKWKTNREMADANPADFPRDPFGGLDGQNRFQKREIQLHASWGGGCRFRGAKGWKRPGATAAGTEVRRNGLSNKNCH